MTLILFGIFFSGINIFWCWYSWGIQNDVNAPYLHDNQIAAQITGGHAEGPHSGGPIRWRAIGGLSHFWTHMFFCGCNRFCLAFSDFLGCRWLRTTNVPVRPQVVILFIADGFVPSQVLLFGHKRCCLATCVFLEIACRLQQHRGQRSCVQIRWTSSS